MRWVWLVCLASVGVGPAVAEPSQAGGRIVYQCCESDAKLVIINANGSHGRLLSGFRIQPSWSPDGRLIAYGSGVSVMHADGRANDRLIVKNGNSPSWAPDGRSLVFQRGRGIWTTRLSGRGQRWLVRHGKWPRWSPDGKLLAFERNNDLFVLDIAHRRERLLIRNARTPDWSPDGRQIAFTRGGVIRVISASGGPSRRVALGDTPAWSPDGRELVFIGRDGSALIRIGVDGTHRRILEAGIYCCVFPDWAPRPGS